MQVLFIWRIEAVAISLELSGKFWKKKRRKIINNYE